MLFLKAPPFTRINLPVHFFGIFLQFLFALTTRCCDSIHVAFSWPHFNKRNEIYPLGIVWYFYNTSGALVFIISHLYFLFYHFCQLADWVRFTSRPEMTSFRFLGVGEQQLVWPNCLKITFFCNVCERFWPNYHWLPSAFSQFDQGENSIFMTQNSGNTTIASHFKIEWTNIYAPKIVLLTQICWKVAPYYIS